MKFATKIAATGIALTMALAASAHSDGHGNNPFSSHINARHGYMNILDFNVGVLVQMARGDVDYDADAAATAANNLAAMSRVNGSAFWAPGSDSDALGGDVTRALPAIWQDFPGFGEDWMAYGAAAAAMAEVAGSSVEELREALGPLGAACTACHRDYRLSNN